MMSLKFRRMKPYYILFESKVSFFFFFRRTPSSSALAFPPFKRQLRSIEAATARLGTNAEDLVAHEDVELKPHSLALVWNMEYPSVGDPLTYSWWPYIFAAAVGIIVSIRSYMTGPDCPSNERVDGKIAIVTGSSSGIGLETALELAKRGAHVILACRDEKLGLAAETQIKKVAKNAHTEVRKLDLSNLTSVHDFVNSLDYEKIDILVNNAGIAFHPFEKTKDGFELHFVTNYLGHFLLTHLILPKLKASENGRIINVTSDAYRSGSINLQDLNSEQNFKSREAFSQSKLALVLMVNHMAKLLPGTSVTINAASPGIVRGTKHMRNSPFSATFITKASMTPFKWLLMKSPSEGAQTSIFLSVATNLNQVSGKYFVNCTPQELAEGVPDDVLAKQLYETSCRLVNLKSEYML